MTEAYTVVNALSDLATVNSSQTIYWNVFGTVVLAILGFLGTDYAQKQSKNMLLLIMAGYCFFAAANISEIFLIQIRINTISSSIVNYIESNPQAVDSSFLPIFHGLPYMNPYVVSLFHLAIDLLVLAILLWRYQVKSGPAKKRARS
jgi:hypothetical protein